MRRLLPMVASILLAIAVMPSGAAAAEAPAGATWTYRDLRDAVAKSEGGYASFDDTATALYESSPHGGYDTTTGRCSICHASHRAEGVYMLTRSDSEADSCVYCHVGSAHSLKRVYDANASGIHTAVGHTIGASPVIPVSSVEMTLTSVVVTTTGSSGVPVTSSVEVRVAGAANRLFRLRQEHAEIGSGGETAGYERIGPTSLTCLSCHSPHGTDDELWHPPAFGETGTRLASGYKLLRSSPSGSIHGPDGMPYGPPGPDTVSYTAEGMKGYRAYTDLATTGLVNAANVIRVPESALTSGTYGPGKTIWDSAAWSGAESTLTPTSTIAVDQYALSVWCADCHNLAIGRFDHGADASRTASAAHETSMTHTVPFRGADNGSAQCYTCHRGGLSSQPATAAFDPSRASCERCHYGTGAYAIDPLRLSGASDWPHSDEDSSAYLLGDWTADASGTIVATAVTAANAGTVVCSRCHTPGRPSHVSEGGASCYVCHWTYAAMDASSGASASAFHHVLGGSAWAGDTPLPAGAYPSSRTELYCTSCHADHDAFAAGASNLRPSVSEPGTVTTDTDFIPSGDHGICLSCHSVALPRSSRQKAGGSTVTPAVSGDRYGASAHSYVATSTFGSSSFRADCSKCHSDGSKAIFQTSQTAFGLHLSAEARLLAAFGLVVPPSAQTGEQVCFSCHSGDVPGPDYYGSLTMSVQARSVDAAFEATGSHHPVSETSGAHRADEDLATAPRHVACEDCHDPHAARPGAHTVGSSVGGGALWGAKGVRPASWPAVGTDAAGTWSAPSTFATLALDGSAGAYEAYVCFKCHSAYTALPPSVTTSSGTYAPTDVARESNPANPSSHNVLGGAGMRSSFALVDSGGTARTVTWDLPTTDVFQPGYDSSSMLTCTSCHAGSGAARGPHGSSVRALLDPAYPSDWKTARLDPSSASGMSPGDILCAKCHDLHGSGGGHGGWSNSVHAGSAHQTDATCNGCHGATPHGWKRPRFLGYTSDPAAYRSTGIERIAVTDHASTSGSADWARSDCQASCHSAQSPLATYWP